MILPRFPVLRSCLRPENPKGLAIIAEFGGTVSIKDTKKKREVVVQIVKPWNQKLSYPYGSRIKVSKEMHEAGDELTEWR